MAGLDTRGLASGFAQGFGLMNQYQRGQRADERADQQMGMQQERMDMQREQFSAQQEDVTRQRDMENIQFTLGKIGSGMEVGEDELETLRKYPKFWSALDPETDNSINQAMSIIDPDTSVDANDPESLDALNQMFGAEINRGEGGQKRVVGMYPAPDGENVVLELEVTGEDGSSYRAPMTEGRGTADDDLVKYVSVEKLVEQVQGMRMLRNTMRSPEAQQRATQVLSLLRGDSNEQWEQVEGPGGSILQRNTKTGETKQVIGRAPQARGSSGRAPSRIQEAQELVNREVYPTFAEAYEAVRARAGQGQQTDTKYIDFMSDEINRVDERLDSYSLSEEERTQLQSRREQLAQELDAASRQAFDRPEQAQPSPEPSAGGPEVGAVEDGYEFLGGDPANPDNWRAR
ncbi:hypothetical protein SAMN04487867_10452 [Vreelandella titanicae]|uniref:hypothetical protein n=1 Tax=Vreelandella titanicae TaxID=664683 RepID=UPI000884B5B4|nr:hypothetical protein [Halomonas titanicae]SDI27697.1 hypothetical protein SAMN04487867_10452 [Halomonas titanicae]